MTIAVVGATGTAGSRTTRQLRDAGHDVRPLSRADGIDLHTGKGLAEALRGVSVVIDTSNPFPSDPDADLVDVFSSSTRRLAEASVDAKVEHLVFLSITNIDSPVFDAFPYYLAKRKQERVVEAADLTSSIIRSAQWHEFATNPAAVTFHDDHVDVEDWLIQPVAVNTVAEVLVDAAVRRPLARQIAGPEQIRLPDLTAAYLQTQADRRAVRTVAPRLAALGKGVLFAPAEADQLGPTVAEWVKNLDR